MQTCFVIYKGHIILCSKQHYSVSASEDFVLLAAVGQCSIPLCFRDVKNRSDIHAVQSTFLLACCAQIQVLISKNWVGFVD